MLSHRLQDPRPILSPEQKQQCDRKWSGPRPSEMTARPLAGSQCAHLRVPILVSKAQRAFYKEQREFSLAQGSDFLPCSSDIMKACGSTPGPLPVPTISTHSSAPCLFGERACFLSSEFETLLPPPSEAQSTALLCVWRQQAAPSARTF